MTEQQATLVKVVIYGAAMLVMAGGYAWWLWRSDRRSEQQRVMLAELTRKATPQRGGDGVTLLAPAPAPN